jgi:hypothetical protein
LLKEVLKDKDVRVAFAASSALLSPGDPSGYTIYREVLVGKRKSGEGALEEEKRLVKDPRAPTLMMLGVAAGFTPYAGYAWTEFKVLSKDYTGPVRVEAALKRDRPRSRDTASAGESSFQSQLEGARRSAGCASAAGRSAPDGHTGGPSIR